MAIYVIDPYYLTISFLITLAWQVTGFFIAWTLQFDKITGTLLDHVRYPI
jgi:hypothetical protein